MCRLLHHVKIRSFSRSDADRWFADNSPILDDSPLGKNASLKFEGDSNSRRLHLTLSQPLTNEKKVLKTWEVPNPQIHLKQAGTLLTETRFLPLAPFSPFSQMATRDQHTIGSFLW